MKATVTRRSILFALALVLAAGRGPAFADERDNGGHDHERAHRALKEGRARPLAEILDRVRGQLGGEVVGIDFEEEDGRYSYEFKVVTPDGRLREVHVDAMTAQILKSEKE